jgi:tRNA dimethylallyltransferase
MSIGTAKPAVEEMRDVKHHFINSHSIQDDVSAAVFAKEAEPVLEQLFKANNYAILVGGSGMFIDALLDGLDDIPASKEVRDELIQKSEENYNLLIEELKERDPIYYNEVDLKNPARVIRALEAIHLTGIPYSQLRKANLKKNNFKVIRIIIEHERAQLYDRINQRVDKLIQAGLVEEVKTLIPYRSSGALRTVGYKEIFEYLDGNLSLEDAIELIKKNTRNYAKRQITWLRRYTDTLHLSFSSLEKMKKEVIDYIENQSNE